jgi:hypothetical protein
MSAKNALAYLKAAREKGFIVNFPIFGGRRKIDKKR